MVFLSVNTGCIEMEPVDSQYYWYNSAELAHFLTKLTSRRLNNRKIVIYVESEGESTNSWETIKSTNIVEHLSDSHGNKGESCLLRKNDRFIRASNAT